MSKCRIGYSPASCDGATVGVLMNSVCMLHGRYHPSSIGGIKETGQRVSLDAERDLTGSSTVSPTSTVSLVRAWRAFARADGCSRYGLYIFRRRFFQFVAASSPTKCGSEIIDGATDGRSQLRMRYGHVLQVTIVRFIRRSFIAAAAAAAVATRCSLSASRTQRAATSCVIVQWSSTLSWKMPFVENHFATDCSFVRHYISRFVTTA